MLVNVYAMWDPMFEENRPEQIPKDKYQFVYNGNNGPYVIDKYGNNYTELSMFISFFGYIEREYGLKMGDVVYYDNTKTVVEDFNRDSSGTYKGIIRINGELISVDLKNILLFSKYRNVKIDDILE